MAKLVSPKYLLFLPVTLFLSNWLVAYQLIHSDQVLEMFDSPIKIQDPDWIPKIMVIPPLDQSLISKRFRIQFWLKRLNSKIDPDKIFNIVFNKDKNRFFMFKIAPTEEINQNNFQTKITMKRNHSLHQFVDWTLVDFEFRTEYSPSSDLDFEVASLLDGNNELIYSNTFSGPDRWQVQTLDIVFGNSSIFEDTVLT